ncbi:unnamed protein product [Moneuplotes crassus]|uniref:Protein kinase domain-containing protein n=1 Tax=Euplotes crassus TaxID=5936 RepID=A0AAD1XTK7_EUPCR|nr:unnamed protein product [Moneuplotes crassus]
MANKNPSMNQKVIEATQKEHQAMQFFSEHPNILTSYYMEENGCREDNGVIEECTYLVLETCVNGTLSHLLARNGALIEPVVKFYFTQLLSAVAYIHSLGYAHLDIKPQNILFDENYNIRLADFGTIEEDVRQDGLCCWKKGTDSFMAPEIKNMKKLQKPYNMYKADVYSLGMTLLIMLTMKHPYSKENNKNDDFISTNNSGDSISSLSNNSESFARMNELEEELGVMNLISFMLHPDPSMRPTCEEIFTHPWMNDSSLDIRNDEVYSQVCSGKDPLFTHNTVTYN